MSYSYSKMNEYVNSLIDVFNMIRNKSLEKKDRRMHLISIMIYNYIQQLIKEHKLTEIKLNNNNGNVDLTPIFDYINYNNIEFFNFKKIDLDEVDISKPSEIERFVLTHIYYITQTV